MSDEVIIGMVNSLIIHGPAGDEYADEGFEREPEVPVTLDVEDMCESFLASVCEPDVAECTKVDKKDLSGQVVRLR